MFCQCLCAEGLKNNFVNLKKKKKFKYGQTPLQLIKPTGQNENSMDAVLNVLKLTIKTSERRRNDVIDVIILSLTHSSPMCYFYTP